MPSLVAINLQLEGRMDFNSFELAKPIQQHCQMCFYKHVLGQKGKITVLSLTLVLRSGGGGGLQQPLKQFLPRCSKMHSKGVKLLWVSLSSSFLFILQRDFEPTTYPGVG